MFEIKSASLGFLLEDFCALVARFLPILLWWLCFWAAAAGSPLLRKSGDSSFSDCWISPRTLLSRNIKLLVLRLCLGPLMADGWLTI